ncbi:S-adenosylmethionine carrier 1, chloroplastic/mitochondrial [Galdieria sulphuraria]|uniref:Mitochondrial carrier (BOU / S-adenosylmethionine carrier) n=1 Tax=Galdieria sulphuraria TaxID=130081 RepID=M2WUE9_GALSU|nr:mitochondrial carrier (BOU / S-adenosylmethionine carrier) [Galdieria sulphuraria]EME27560.1 mitochondrial carrier (BOU / S-adenosylmethionine carrier) [Galdieria sulphuraria]GJD09755.1 S-adenosylmethionine carrier 1, chloroplastic/mitochondrial [Galdieria sulphuraria]|eukprot:XP_005704080.1 mitochondrial carrier (BOU / S-adenosylmethionine carrier) [Galdieria sulphuraria]
MVKKRNSKRLKNETVVSGGKISYELNFLEKLLSGAIARGVAQTFLHPVDVARTRLQAKGVKRNWSPGVFTKGVIPQIVLAVPAGAIQFLSYEFCKDKLQVLLPNVKFQALRDLLAGAGGALAASVVRVPQEVLKQRIQADIYPNVVVALPTVLREEGFRGLYKGYFATISRDVPWNALSFLFHAQLKRLFGRLRKRQPTNRENLFLAGAGGTLAAVIMTPVDVVKTRLMTQRVSDTLQYKGIFPTLQRIFTEEGPTALFKGVIPRVMFLAPLAAITLSLYEGISRYLIQRKQQYGTKSYYNSSASIGVPCFDFGHSFGSRIRRHHLRQAYLTRGIC